MPEQDRWLREFGRMPTAWPAYLRAVLAAGKHRQSDDLPPLVARVRGVPVDGARVARFRSLFGLSPDGPVPLTYAHLLAFPLHLRLLTDPEFPLRVLGTVHLRNPVRQQRALRIGEAVDIEVRLAGPRAVPQGLEHDLVTEVRDRDGALVWTGTSTNLLRGPRTAPRARPPEAGPGGQPAWERAWNLWLPADAGRRYAALSGDWNPIHLSAASARLFGFRRAILHGMATWAQVLARLEPHLPEGALCADVRFLRPVLLPGRAVVRALRSNGQDAWRWSVQDARGQVFHAEGEAGAAPPVP